MDVDSRREGGKWVERGEDERGRTHGTRDLGLADRSESKLVPLVLHLSECLGLAVTNVLDSQIFLDTVLQAVAGGSRDGDIVGSSRRRHL